VSTDLNESLAKLYEEVERLRWRAKMWRDVAKLFGIVAAVEALCILLLLAR